jgi:GxxExxY protein
MGTESKANAQVADGEPARLSLDPLRHRELTEKILGIFYDVYNELGHGFLEQVYARSMEHALTTAGLLVAREVPIAVWFRGVQVGDFKADLLVENKILLELKAARTIDAAFEKQLLNYLRATEIETGLLLNFGNKPEFRRFAFENSRKKIRVHPRVSAAEK